VDSFGVEADSRGCRARASPYYVSLSFVSAISDDSWRLAAHGTYKVIDLWEVADELLRTQRCNLHTDSG